MEIQHIQVGTNSMKEKKMQLLQLQKNYILLGKIETRQATISVSNQQMPAPYFGGKTYIHLYSTPLNK